MAGIESVDKFLHSKFLGAKRFSIAGAEAMIALLDCTIEEGAELGINGRSSSAWPTAGASTC
jgi:2-oxoglutarate dehydrogenase complex dehydrogenase (E1) component-like enzyme